MARKSTIGDASDAFELFLDTITNTFGGVVFISLLVCVLLQIRGASVETDAEADAVRARTIAADLTAVRSEIATLEELDRRMRGQAAATTQQTDRRLVPEYERLCTEKQLAESELSRLDAEEPLRKDEAANLQTQLTGLQAEQDRLRNQVRELESKLADTQNRSSHKIRLPRYRPTVKMQIPLAVFGQHVYFPYKYDGRGRRVAMNEADFMVLSVLSGDTELTPKPGRGTPVANNDGFRSGLRHQLAQFDKETSYVHLAVWPDSYTECEIVRDVLIDTGFGYGLILLDSDDKLVLSSTAQRGEM